MRRASVATPSRARGARFEPYRPGWFEEPIPFENARAMVRLQREMPVPIATGERLLSRWEFRELLEEGGCKIIQPDLAAMHLAAAIPNFFILEPLEDERALRDELCTQPVGYADGYFELPGGPGLGTDLRLEVLAERGFRPQPPARSSESLWH